jgi:organic hydroperoxide reductase OsmC/OhrA
MAGPGESRRRKAVPVSRTHSYEVSVTWTGNRGTGTSGYRAYDRDHDVAAAGPPPIAASSDREAHARCFIANSVNFPVRHEPVTTADGG